jgi:hypothetical protein
MLAEIFMLSVEPDGQRARDDPAVHLDRDRVLIEDSALWRLGHGFTPERLRLLRKAADESFGRPCQTVARGEDESLAVSESARAFLRFTRRRLHCFRRKGVRPSSILIAPPTESRFGRLFRHGSYGRRREQWS